MGGRGVQGRDNTNERRRETKRGQRFEAAIDP